MPAIQTIKGDQLITSSVAIGHQPGFIFQHDGLNVLDLSGSIILRHSGSVPVSPVDAGIIYYDKVTQKLRSSLNGAIAEDIVLGSIIGQNKGPAVGQNIYDGNSDSKTLAFRRLIPGTGIQLLSGSDTVMVSFTGSTGITVVLGQNVGVGHGLFQSSNGSDTLRFRSLLAGSNIGITSGSSEITIAFTGSAGGSTGQNKGPAVGENVYDGNQDNNTLAFRRLIPGTGIQLLSGSDTVMISFTGSGGGATGVNNGPQVGQDIYNGNIDSSTLSFRRMLAGTNIGLLSGSDTIMISLTGAVPADGINVGGGQGPYNGNQDTDTLSFRSLLPGYGIGLGSGSQTIMINATGSLVQFSKTVNIIYPTTNTVYPIWRVPYSCTASSFSGYMLSGSRARLDVYKNVAANSLFPTGTIVPAAQTWFQNNSVHGENGNFVVGDTLIFRILEITGAVGQITMQLNLSVK